MEENIHDGKLDDFVRKSFEDYEEDPSSDMWNRVSGALASDAPAPQVLLSFRRYAWKLVAGLVIMALFFTLVCQHRYYQAELNRLSEKVSDAAIMNGIKNTETSQTNSGQPDPKPIPPVSVTTESGSVPANVVKTEAEHTQKRPKSALVDI
jgi:hypothetical protein